MGDSARSENFHSILGIPKSASLADIKNAYKSLVTKWHPEKNPSNREEAEAKLRAINEAYRALSIKKKEEETTIADEPTTPETSFRGKSADEGFFSRLARSASRRSKTPTPNMRSFSRNASRRRSKTPTPITDFYTSANGGGAPSPTTPMTPLTPTSPMTPKGAAPAPSPSKATSRWSTTPIIFSGSTVKRKPQPVEKKLECSLEDLCLGCVKNIKITRDALSEAGLIIQEEEILRIKIKPGWKKGTKITFEGKGNQRPGMLPADIIFIIDEKRHPMFKREGDDIELGVEVPLVQALTGCTITLPLLGGEKMTLSFDDIIYPGYEKIIPGQGMPKSKEQGKRGNLRLKFLVDFPLDLSDEQRADVVSILNESS